MAHLYKIARCICAGFSKMSKKTLADVSKNNIFMPYIILVYLMHSNLFAPSVTRPNAYKI